MTPKDALRAFHAAFVARDVDASCALYADDAINHQVAEEARLLGQSDVPPGARAASPDVSGPRA